MKERVRDMFRRLDRQDQTGLDDKDSKIGGRLQEGIVTAQTSETT